MSASAVREYLKKAGYEDRIRVHTEPIETVESAARVIGCSQGQIAKTLSFGGKMPPVLVVMAGDLHVNSSKFKAQFGCKPGMLPRDEVLAVVGHAPGGVCPFAIPEGLPVYLDVSLKRYETVHPAGGDCYTSVTLSVEELFVLSRAVGWCDVGKAPQIGA